MKIEVLDYRLYMAVHVDVCEYSERIITSFFIHAKVICFKTKTEEKF